MAILCGTDLSPASTGAFEVARALAAQRGDREVVLAHVTEHEPANEAEAAALRERIMASAAGAGAAVGPTVRVELVIGAADQSLVGLAEAEGAELIVIAASSRERGAARLGTTASHVIARTHVPVLAVRDPEPWLAFARGARPLKILLGIDDSATCDLGVQWTLALGTQGRIDVVLGAIYYPDDAATHYGVPRGGMVESAPEIERLIERDLLRRFAGAAASAASSITACARRGLGRIGDHMIELAREQQVDAIIVGTSQKTGLGRLGSVSSVIVEEAGESVVCVPPQAVVATHAVPVLQRALVATDLSQFANRAVPYAFSLTPPHGEVHVVYVAKADDEIDEAELLAQLRALAPTGARQNVHAHVVRGEDPAPMIAQCAARYGVDVICIASHGRSGISRALIGSVADKLLHVTRLPVLVLRPA